MRYLCETLGNRENCQLTYLTTEIAGCVMEERAQKDRRRGERRARWKCRERQSRNASNEKKSSGNSKGRGNLEERAIKKDISRIARYVI